MNTPSNNQVQATTSDTLNFSGYMPLNWAAVGLQYQDLRSGWVPFGSIPPSSSGIVDGAGATWYPWFADVSIASNGGWYVRSNPGQRNMVKKVRAVVEGTANSEQNFIPLDTFEADASTCALNFTAISDIISHCKSPESPVVSLRVPCGRPGQTACTGDCGPEIGEACPAPCDGDYNGRVENGACRRSAKITLRNPAPSEVTVVVPSEATYAYSFNEGDLVPLRYGRGSVQFTPDGAPEQELTVFEFPFGYDPQSQGGSATVADVAGGHWPCLPSKFASVRANNGRTGIYSVPHGAGHVVRYVHGSCAKRVDWRPILEQLSSNITQQVVANAKTSGFTTKLEFDVAQPQFRSRGTNMQWGFMFEGSYFLNLGVINAHLSMNPAYALSPRPEDGRVAVTAITESVVVIPQNDRAKNSTMAALRDVVPHVFGSVLNGALDQPLSLLASTLNLPEGLLPNSCTPGADLATQQEQCFGPLRDLLPLFGGDPRVQTLAAGLEARNFSCRADATCAFHPIVQAVNVLPEWLELVFAPDPNAAGNDVLTPMFDMIKAQQPAVCDPLPPIDSDAAEFFVIPNAHHGNISVTQCR